MNSLKRKAIHVGIALSLCACLSGMTACSNVFYHPANRTEQVKVTVRQPMR